MRSFPRGLLLFYLHIYLSVLSKQRRPFLSLEEQGITENISARLRAIFSVYTRSNFQQAHCVPSALWPGHAAGDIWGVITLLDRHSAQFPLRRDKRTAVLDRKELPFQARRMSRAAYVSIGLLAWSPADKLDVSVFLSPFLFRNFPSFAFFILWAVLSFSSLSPFFVFPPHESGARVTYTGTHLCVDLA